MLVSFKKYILFLLLSGIVTIVVGGNINTEYIRFNNEFAIRLLEELPSTEKGNLVFSAFALETVLGLLSTGARGETVEEIKETLRFPSGDEKLKELYHEAHTEINSANNVSISSANRIYIKKGLSINPDFNTTASNIFKAGVQNINFSCPSSAQEINSWVEKQTNRKIKDLVKPEQLNDQTKMVLVNSLYFKGDWFIAPEKILTKDFHLSKNETIPVDTMVFEGIFPVHRMPKHKTVFLRLLLNADKRAYISIVLPEDNDKLVGMQKRLRKAVADQSYEEEYARIYIPKFRIENSLDMKSHLERMGIKKLFSTPDLSGITKESIAVDSINQKVFIDVDENGIEAASGTAAIANKRILPIPKQNPTEYHVDHPFIYCLQYDEVALITGRVTNPSKD